jgi:hypothetical protein
MELPDIEELMRTASLAKANAALKDGWKLVTVVTPVGKDGVSVPTYILGWPAGKPGKPAAPADEPFSYSGVL